MNKNKYYKKAAEELWNILDNIDSSSDAIKPVTIIGYKKFYEATMKRCKKRFNILKGDGYKLSIPNEKKFILVRLSVFFNKNAQSNNNQFIFMSHSLPIISSIEEIYSLNDKEWMLSFSYLNMILSGSKIIVTR